MATTVTEKLSQIVREAIPVVQEMFAVARRARAWDLLQEHDADGRPLGPLPYTDDALREFTAIHREQPDDVTVIHHLAVGHHARAWDMELRGDSGAAAEWELALGYWRALANSGEFWEGLRGRLAVLDPAADPEVLTRARAALLEDLLDIHVDFIRHYSEMNQPERANAHVEIIRRSTIPPAIKKRLTDRIFQTVAAALTGSVEKQAQEAALAALERFLSTFPEHLPALRQHAEIAATWVRRLSWQDQWPVIASIHPRALPVAIALAAHPDLPGQPLAKVAVSELADKMAVHGLHRGTAMLKEFDAGVVREQDVEQATAALDLAVAWAQLGAANGRRESTAATVLPECLNERGRLAFTRATEEIVDRSGHGARAGKRSTTRLLEQAVADVRQALSLSRKNKPTLAKNLEILESALREHRSAARE